MKTSRNDVVRNKQQAICPNSSWLGFSSSKLKFGDFFLTSDKRLAKCHGQIKPTSGGPWLILAQVASDDMQYSMERWIEPNEVIQTIPADRCNKNIASFFVETEDFFA